MFSWRNWILGRVKVTCISSTSCKWQSWSPNLKEKLHSSKCSWGLVILKCCDASFWLDIGAVFYEWSDLLEMMKWSECGQLPHSGEDHLSWILEKITRLHPSPSLASPLPLSPRNIKTHQSSVMFIFVSQESNIVPWHTVVAQYWFAKVEKGKHPD